MRKNIYSIVTVGLVLGLLIPIMASAAKIETGEQPSLPSGLIQDDVYIFGANVSSNANVVGDLIAGGGNVLINGSVSQDLFVGGGSVTIIADVRDDLRVGGGNISIVGSVGGDLIVGGGQTQISGSGINGDLIWGGGTLQLNAPVRGDLKLGGGEVYINAPISGDVTFKGEKLTLGSNAVINGSLSYETPKEADILDGARVIGETSYKPLETKATPTKTKINAGALAAIISAVFLAKFLMWLVAALIFGLLLKRFSTTLVNNALSRPLTELGRGFLELLVIPVASVILLVTVIGIPLGVIGILGYIVILMFAALVSPLLVGSLLHKWVKKPAEYQLNWKIITIGVIVYCLLGLIPVIGWIIRFGFMLMTMGALLKIKMSVIKDWR